MDQMFKLTDNGESYKHKYIGIVYLHILFADRNRYGFLSIPVIF